MNKKDKVQNSKKMSEEAIRALDEARLRRQKKIKQTLPTELGGRDGPDPVRFGDWEKKGIATDF